MSIGLSNYKISNNLYLGDLAFQNSKEFIETFGVYTAAASAPLSPKENDIWFDTVNGITYRWYVDSTSSQWVEFTGGIAGLLNTLPSTPQGNIVEINLGNTPVRAGSFIINGSGFTTSRPVNVFQSIGPYTGKGDFYDESEMDFLICNAAAISTTQIQVYWQSNTYVSGNFRFCYVLL